MLTRLWPKNRNVPIHRPLYAHHQALLPEHRGGVRRELRIVCHQGQTFPVGLRDEKAVEGIPVVQGQAIQGVDML
jgi:hypothetical protein